MSLWKEIFKQVYGPGRYELRFFVEKRVSDTWVSVPVKTDQFIEVTNEGRNHFDVTIPSQGYERALRVLAR